MEAALNIIIFSNQFNKTQQVDAMNKLAILCLNQKPHQCQRILHDAAQYSIISKLNLAIAKNQFSLINKQDLAHFLPEQQAIYFHLKGLQLKDIMLLKIASKLAQTEDKARIYYDLALLDVQNWEKHLHLALDIFETLNLSNHVIDCEVFFINKYVQIGRKIFAQQHFNILQQLLSEIDARIIYFKKML